MRVNPRSNERDRRAKITRAWGVRWLVAVAIAAGGSGATSWAAAWEAPYSTYLAKLIQEENERRADYWEWNSAGYLFRFRLDVDGDGETEVFLTSSQETSRYRSVWHAFKAEAGGSRFTEYPVSLWLGFFGCVMAREEGRTTLLDWRQSSSSEWKPVVHRYDFRDGTLTERGGEIAQEDFDALQSSVDQPKGKLRSFKPALEAISIYDLLVKPEAEWFAVSEEDCDPSWDFALVKGRGSHPETFTPKVAVAMVAAREAEEKAVHLPTAAGEPDERRLGLSAAVTTRRTTEIAPTNQPIASAPAHKAAKWAMSGAILALVLLAATGFIKRILARSRNR